MGVDHRYVGGYGYRSWVGMHASHGYVDEYGCKSWACGWIWV